MNMRFIRINLEKELKNAPAEGKVEKIMQPGEEPGGAAPEKKAGLFGAIRAKVSKSGQPGAAPSAKA